MQWPANLRQVLDVVALVVVAALAEQTMMHHVVNVELVEQGVPVLFKSANKTHVQE